MGLGTSQELAEEFRRDLQTEVFCRTALHSAHKLREFLGFQDPQDKLQPSLDTLNEVFLVHFITSCIERGFHDRIVTSKMTKQQSLLLGVDWLWTLLGPDGGVILQFPVQTWQLADRASKPPEAWLEPHECVGRSSRERAAAAALFWNKSRLEKLEEFCSLVERDCLGMLLVFGLPGRPRDISGVMLNSLKAWGPQRLSLDGEGVLRDFFTYTTSSISVRELLEHYIDKREQQNDVGNVYIKFISELPNHASFQPC